MSIPNIILLIAGLLNLAMSLFIISRGWKNKINLYFSLLTFSTFLWAVSLFIGRVLESDVWFLGAQFAYPAALGIAVSLLYFTIYFPFVTQTISKIKHLFILIPFVLLSFIIFTPNLFIINYINDFSATGYILYYLKPMYLLYAVYFFILIISAVYNLYIKYKSVELIFKKQIIFLLIAIIIGLLVGTYFDLILCYFNDFKYAWIGPPFTLLMNAVVFYLIFSARDKINDKS